MSSIKTSTRYSNILNSSTKSDPSSSNEFPSSRALTKKNNTATDQFTLTSMVKKLVQNKKPYKEAKLIVPADFLANELKKNAKKSTGISGLHKKLFKGSSSVKKGEESSRKALTEVKSNTRTLAMVLRSERELLNANKEQEEVIAELKLLLEEKNVEAEKLRDLCLKQREEIKSLKNSLLFPDAVNSKLEYLLEKKGSELNQAKQLIPSLQRQVASLTGQLQCLAEDLAEVKAEKHSGKGFWDDHFSSPRTPTSDQEDTANSLFDQQFSSGDYTTPDSPDDMLLKDLNPCLTPYKAKKTDSKEFDGYDSPPLDVGFSKSNMQSSHEYGFKTCATKLSKSSDCCKSSKTGLANGITRPTRRSNESKFNYGNQTCPKIF